MESERASALASIGLAVRATAPALLHAIRGCLHDVTMLAALLQPPAASGAEGGGPAAKTAQRLHAINAQLELLERNVALLSGMIEGPRQPRDAVCVTASALPDVLRLLEDEAARRRIRLEHSLDGLPKRLATDERSLQQALLACGAWTAQHAGEGATMRLSGREEGGDAVFEYLVIDAAMRAHDSRAAGDEIALLAALAEAAGGRLASTQTLALAFPRTPEHRSTAA
jgi:hypothetical protein